MIDEPTGLRAMADRLEDQIMDLSAQLEVATTRAERSRLNRALHWDRDMLAWLKSRAGY